MFAYMEKLHLIKKKLMPPWCRVWYLYRHYQNISWHSSFLLPHQEAPRVSEYTAQYTLSARAHTRAWTAGHGCSGCGRKQGCRRCRRVSSPSSPPRGLCRKGAEWGPWRPFRDFGSVAPSDTAVVWCSRHAALLFSLRCL